MTQFAILPPISENPILLELRDAALYARINEDYRWLNSVAEVFLRLVERKYEPTQQLTDEWRSYNNKIGIVRFLFWLLGKMPDYISLEKQQEISELLHHARLLRKAAQDKDASAFLRLCQGIPEFDTSIGFV